MVYVSLTSSRAWAQEMDRCDDLAGFRSRFYIPDEVIYMDGNSLGLQSRDAAEELQRTAAEWRDLAIGGWLDADPPWFNLGEDLGRRMAPLVGAAPDEVVAAGSTTVNLHALLGSFYRPGKQRKGILGDELNFPSDIYALRSHLQLRGMDPEEHLVLVRSRDGRVLDEGDIIAHMTSDVAVCVLPSVLYRSGQLLDVAGIAAAANERGILTGLDLSHSVGALPHSLSDWGVDFAFWCTYKYLNSGPGGIAGLYVNRKHFCRSPGLAGWWGSDKDQQFAMSLDFHPAGAAGAWQIGTPGVLSAAPLLGSLRVFADAGIERVRAKSLRLTAYLIDLIDEELSGCNCRVGSPRESTRRGGHVAVEHPEARRVCAALRARGVVPDFRPPHIIRLAPVALYNTFTEVHSVVGQMKEILETREYERFPCEGPPVS